MGNVNSYAVYGLTGGIGSGKSTVAHLFAQRGIPVLDLDAVGHHLLSHDESLKAALCHTFGSSIVQRDHSIDRARLAQLAFRDAATTEQLNQIVHPRIWQQAEQWHALQQDAPFAVIEASVLIESYACERVDAVMVVLSDLALRQQRVLQRGKQNQATFHSIVARQCSDEQRVQVAHHLIYNNGTRKQLQQTVQMLYQQLL
jgi:dephospho-CoA kinase